MKQENYYVTEVNISQVTIRYLKVKPPAPSQATNQHQKITGKGGYLVCYITCTTPRCSLLKNKQVEIIFKLHYSFFEEQDSKRRNKECRFVQMVKCPIHSSEKLNKQHNIGTA